MWPALIRLITTQPAWLAGHAEAYVDLLAAELGAASALWQRRLLFWVLALCSLVVAATLAGVATMLAVLAPEITHAASWALLLTPLLPLMLAAVCMLAARSSASQAGLVGVRDQVQADMALLRELSAG
jgi:hypothetical protein